MNVDLPDPLHPSHVSAASAVPALFVDALPPDVAELLGRMEDYARAAAGAFADNTVRALAADSRVFAAWCRANGRQVLPAPPATVAAFIDAQAALKAPATVARYRSSIAALHRAAGVPNPCNEELVRLAIRRMNRAHGTRQKQAEPLNRPSVERMLTTKTPERCIGALPRQTRRCR